MPLVLSIFVVKIDAFARKMQQHYLEIVILQGKRFLGRLCRRKYCLYLIRLDILYNTEYLIQ